MVRETLGLRPYLGLQKYEYNFLMQGLKKYHCGRCLFQFGCLSALLNCCAL